MNGAGADPARIVALVEGQGEVAAVPTLVHRVVKCYHPTLPAPVVAAFRVRRDKVLREAGERDRCVALAKTRAPTGILVLLDADDACAAREGPALQADLAPRCPGVLVQVVFAVREYESWFLAALHSVREALGIPSGTPPPADPESVRGAKEYLTRLMPAHKAYSPTVDQKSGTSALDLAAARAASPSFDKLCRAVGELVGA